MIPQGHGVILSTSSIGGLTGGLGTHVYNLCLRHPFIAARAVQTLDIVSGGRLECGIGASWLEEEWKAAGCRSP